MHRTVAALVLLTVFMGGTDAGTDTLDGVHQLGDAYLLDGEVDLDALAISWWVAVVRPAAARVHGGVLGAKGYVARAQATVALGVGRNVPPVTSTVQEIVCAPQWSWDCGWALRVVGCESSWDPSFVNPAGPYLGLFQIWLGHLRPGGILEGMAEIELLAVEGNIRAAHSVYKAQGPGAWPSC